MERTTEDAVSPVVGVMLMLVVVIIIAAVVSAFAGGMAKSNDKAPQASIHGSLSQSTGLVLYHNGGDTLTTKDTIITIRPTSEFGEGLDERASAVVNKSFITDVNGLAWVNLTTGTIDVPAFSPGATMYINLANLKTIGSQSGAGRLFATSAGSSTESAMWYQISLLNPANVGKNVIIEVDTVSGQMVSTVKIPVKP
jgi:FlaG/FlaF family flagellin (archaellin)